jgi:hypothetical protein
MLVSGGTVATEAWVSCSLTNFTQSALLHNLHFIFCLNRGNGLAISDFEWVWPW